MGDHRREADWRDDRAWKRHREDPLACHNCGERGHLAKDCLSTHGKEIKDKVLVKDRRMKPRVIGTGGGVIKGLEQELGVRLKVEDVVRDDPDQGFYVRISGPGLDEVCRAVTRVEKLVAEVEAEQRLFEERRAQYQTQIAGQSALQEQAVSAAAAQPLAVALNAALQGNSGGQAMQQFRTGGIGSRLGAVGNSTQRSTGMTSARNEYGVAMNQTGFPGIASAGGGQAQGAYVGGGGSFNQGADPNRGVDPFQTHGLNQGASADSGVAPEQGSVYNQGGAFYQQGTVNLGGMSNQGMTQNAVGKPSQQFEYDQAGTPLEQNMEMSPDRKEASNPGIPSYAAMAPQQVGVRSVDSAYLAGGYGSGALSGSGALGGGLQDREGGARSAKATGTLDELESRNNAEYLELAKQQMFEEDEEINRHRTRMREIQDYFQLRLSTLRQKQAQQREEVLVSESQQRSQQLLQQYQAAKALAGNGPASAQQGAGDPRGTLGVPAQYNPVNAYSSAVHGFEASGRAGTEGYGDNVSQGAGFGNVANYVGQAGTGVQHSQPGQQYASYG